MASSLHASASSSRQDYLQGDCWDLKASTSTASPRTDHSYIHPNHAKVARAPCPALNTLANHGYIPDSGRDITFLTLLRAVMEVYNISLLLTLILMVPAFLIYGQLQIHWDDTSSNGEKSSSKKRRIPSISYTLTLSSLSSFGPGLRIAHRASFVHPDYPSDSPDSTMVKRFISYGQHAATESFQSTISSTTTVSSSTNATNPGLTLNDLAFIRVSRESALPKKDKLDNVHTQVALGESALTWLLFARSIPAEKSSKAERPSSIIPVPVLAQWFGEERLPEGWTRPAKTVGLFSARRVASQVRGNMEKIKQTYRYL
ncbi:hypothetical protein D9757_003182 [Collybiopsis confluens]|uniref:Heme haloperoxidase family profile domain-containing protein n=1 Tax=Collybiopsis confluens TaxID=2823264 RepID=A0A8H5MFQ0_9AGAR|nr:hypothetical protein D9757_003182 [Collybiopsis confluens]